jgi:hypothetical protein
MWADGSPVQRCARCRRLAPHQLSAAFLEWEALDEEGAVVCPDCLTPEEQQEMLQDAEEMTAELRRRGELPSPRLRLLP